MSAPGSALLTYHSLDQSGSVISCSPARFRQHLESLHNAAIPVVPLDQVLKTPGAVAITFDDGFENLAEHAIPCLEEFQMPATIFIVSRYCGRSNNWPSQPAGSVPELPLLDWAALRRLSPLITLGVHTATHPDLRQTTPEECERELTECQDELQQRLGRPARWLAYPYGGSSAAVRRCARQHFDLAVGTRLRYLAPTDDPCDLPRLDAYYLRSWPRLDGLFSPAARTYLAARRTLRQLRAAFHRD